MRKDANQQRRWSTADIQRRARFVDDAGPIRFVDTEAAARYLALEAHTLECYTVEFDRSCKPNPPISKQHLTKHQSRMEHLRPQDPDLNFRAIDIGLPHFFGSEPNELPVPRQGGRPRRGHGCHPALTGPPRLSPPRQSQRSTVSARSLGETALLPATMKQRSRAILRGSGYKQSSDAHRAIQLV